jgi:hypothetical protein
LIELSERRTSLKVNVTARVPVMTQHGTIVGTREGVELDRKDINLLLMRGAILLAVEGEHKGKYLSKALLDELDKPVETVIEIKEPTTSEEGIAGDDTTETPEGTTPETASEPPEGEATNEETEKVDTPVEPYGTDSAPVGVDSPENTETGDGVDSPENTETGDGVDSPENTEAGDGVDPTEEESKIEEPPVETRSKSVKANKSKK